MPLAEHEIVYQPAAVATGSEKLTVMSAAVATSVAPFAGLVDVTLGAASPPVVTVCAPSPVKSPFGKPSHSTAGSNASPPFESPLWMVGFRRIVLSVVFVGSVPQPASPGLNPI